MTATYLIRAVSEFSAAHVLKGYPGACNRVHGHNWRVTVEALSTTLDDVGMGIDFNVLQEATAEIVAALDHRLLNDVEPFTDKNPTAENVAAHIFESLARRLPELPRGDAVSLQSVTVSENDRSSVTYRP